MRVALVGNMNNNFFSLMRYLRDLGVDAYLLLYTNELTHFKPENDTWDIEKWKPYILQTKILNGSLKYLLNYNKAFLRTELDGFDYYIANGFAPALFNKAGMSIDLFLPYSVGIEYTYFYNKSRINDYLLEPIIRYFQKKGLKNNVKLLGTVDKEAFSKSVNYQLKTIPLAMPMVYLERDTDNLMIASDLINRIRKYSLKVLSHVSHFHPGTQAYGIKRNDIIIKGFSEYIKATNDQDSVLILLDYGPGVEDSKRLIADNDIIDSVIWLPKMSRKQLMLIIKHIDIGAGEFGGEMWGGTVWEFMSLGKPFFQFVNLTNQQIEEQLNAPCPQFFNTADPESIAKILNDFRINRTNYAKIGKDLSHWFERYGGTGLAEVYKNIILGC